MENHKKILVENGWRTTEDFSEKCEYFDLERIKVFQFATSREEYVTWDMMLNRSEKNNAIGTQEMAEYMIIEQDKIPESWREYNLIFPRTIWKSTTNHRLCPFLKFKDNKWILGYYWFLYDFHHNDRFLLKRVDGELNAS